MAAIGSYLDNVSTSIASTSGGWDPNATHWGWAELVYYETGCPDYKGQLETLTRRLRREAKTERNRIVIRGIARLQASRAHAELQARRRFARFAGKRWTMAQRARAGRRLA